MKKIIKYAPWYIVIAALLWTLDAPFRKYLTGELPSSLIVLSEHIIIFFFVLPIFLKNIREIKNMGWREWSAVLFIGVGGSALATVFFTQSFHYVNPSVAILLQKVQPFIAILLAVTLLKEVLPKRFYLWAFIGIIGAYLITFPEIFPNGLSLKGGTLGVIYALLAAFFWGGSTVMGRFMLSRVSWTMMTALRFVVALIFLIILNAYNGSLAEYARFTPKDALYVAIIAILAGFISLFIYYRGLKDTRASVATVGELAFPFFAVIINWIFLDATLRPEQIAGGVILLIAITQVTGANYESIKKENESAAREEPLTIKA